MTDEERRESAEIQRNIAEDVAVGEARKRDMAEQRALEAEEKATDARRMTHNMAASSLIASEAADAAQRSSFATGLIALFVIVGLLLGGIVLFNNYRAKNDQLYSANVQEDRSRTENRVLRETAARESQRADAATQAAAAAAVQPTPEVHVNVIAPTPAPQPPANINVVIPPANPGNQPGPDEASPAPETSPTADTTDNNSDNSGTTVTVPPNH